MITVHTPPSTAVIIGNTCKLFLAGTIDNGESYNWQREIIEYMHEKFHMCCLDIYNPRREDWDKSWNTANDPRLRRQIQWELEYLEQADVIAMVLLPESKSPISLMELGYHLRMGTKRIVVFCPDEFYRKLNVDIICGKHDIIPYEDWDIFKIELKRKVEAFILKKS